MPEPRRSCLTCRAAARSARAETWRRSPTWLCRWSERARPGSTIACLPGAEALAAAGLEPIRLQAKEGLSLVNGTQFMAAFGALGLMRARRLAKTADIACTLSLEALQGSRTSFLPQIHATRPLRGQTDSAANVLVLLEDSAINEAHRWCDKVQDAYSLRCAPQVHGASRDLLDYVELHGLDGAELRDGQPARARRGRHARLQRELPRPARRVRARLPCDGRLRAGGHRRAARRATRQSESLGRPARRSSPATAGSTRAS